MASETDNPSAAESGLNLLGLAPEIIQNIIKYASKKDLQNIRLVNKQLDEHAVRELFREVFLSPSEEHMATYTSISEHDTLRRLPRSAVIWSQPDINMDGAGHADRDAEDRGEEYEDAIAALARFPNIDSLEIGFTPTCVGERETSWYEDVEETSAVRKEVLGWIFQAVRDRAAADPTSRAIRSLTIVNLQNCPIPDFTRSDLFRDVVAGLEELHLEVTQEYSEPGPDHDYTRAELRTFPTHLVSDWLRPASASLKALSIYSRTDNWGPFPGYFRPAGLSFPKLETLSLGYYTLAHDDDLDWLLEIKSLRRLVLHSCMVLTRARFQPENMDEWGPRTAGWGDVPEGLDGDDLQWPQFAYGGTWAEFFGRVAGALPGLVDFRFDTESRWGRKSRYGVRHRHSCGARVFPQRYLVFDNGILPTHWPEAKEDGSIYSWTKVPFPNFHVERREEDQRGLDELLEACRRRRVTGGGGIYRGD